MQVGIAKDFQISQTQVSNINRNEQKILEEWKFGNLIILITNIIYETEQSCIKNFLSEVLKNLLIFKLQLS